MSLLTALILSMAIITSLLLFGMIYYGVKNRKDMNELGKNLDASASAMEGNLHKLLKTLEENGDQQERILSRLQNLETIVTSEAWDAIQAGKDSDHLDVLLEDEPTEEKSTEEKAQHIANRIKQ